jgi:NAD-dependent dihydropyrimidine dehydrogenase PreA subunit
MLKIILDEDICIQCGRCVDACPIPCFEFDEAETCVSVINQDGCLVCRNCEEECPKNCIHVEHPYQSTVNYF